jgi:class 3 adenylate cyclase
VAIFAADVEGYSRPMDRDEVATLRDLTERRHILDGLIASHRGRIANTAGDSVLAEFSKAPLMRSSVPSRRKPRGRKPTIGCPRTVASNFGSGCTSAT